LFVDPLLRVERIVDYGHAAVVARFVTLDAVGRIKTDLVLATVTLSNALAVDLHIDEITLLVRGKVEIGA
jgi:hypothetical protein